MNCLENVNLGWSKNFNNHNLKPGLKVPKVPPSSDDNTLSHSRSSLSFYWTMLADQKKVFNPKRSCLAFTRVNDACIFISIVICGSCTAQVIISSLI